MARVLICGGRNLNPERVAEWLSQHARALAGGIEHIIAGDARGADFGAVLFASRHAIPSSRFRADWNKHGRAAGPIRNQQMLTEGRPDTVIAFPGGAGTADMVRRSRESGLIVIQVEGKF